MSTKGLSVARLSRMHDVMAGHVERGAVPGVVTLIWRRGHVHVDTIGAKALGGDPIRPDTIFRITSMTKPVTAVAAMILVEECKLRLDDPVDPLLPELADRRVLARLDGPLDDTVPASRPLTLRDLLTFRMGFGLVMGPPDQYPIVEAANELGVRALGPPTPPITLEPDEWIRRLGTLPLMRQPGETWMYNTGSCVLGVLIARAAGQPFEDFLQERIFGPLGMHDTGFFVPEDKLDRLATSYAPDPESGELRVLDGVEDGQWAQPPVFPDGGAGLVSTIDDFVLFGEMMLNGGRCGSERILSRPAIEAMTTDQLTPAQKEGAGFVPGYWDNRGWGFGVSVVTGRDDVSAVPGRFGWDGGYGTSWYSDPAEELVGILMTQRAGLPELNPVYLDFWTSAYQAIDD
jgi:CubicO group peptidase (beta-lactamase class C family)